jgi:hypothetical protein
MRKAETLNTAFKPKYPESANMCKFRNVWLTLPASCSSAVDHLIKNGHEIIKSVLNVSQDFVPSRCRISAF